MLYIYQLKQTKGNKPMKFTKATEANGTHLQGNVGATYQELVEVFGEPIRYDSDGTTHMNNKTDAEWRISFEDGTKATIYNYKNVPIIYQSKII